MRLFNENERKSLLQNRARLWKIRFQDSLIRQF